MNVMMYEYLLNESLIHNCNSFEKLVFFFKSYKESIYNV